MGLQEQKQHFSVNLLDWYMVNRRDLPWRRHNNPYYIWVSEIMLQQTRVDTVIPYFNRFIGGSDGGGVGGCTRRRRLEKLGGTRLLLPCTEPSGMRRASEGELRRSRCRMTSDAVFALKGGWPLYGGCDPQHRLSTSRSRR